MTDIDIRQNGGASLAVYRDGPQWDGRRTLVFGKFAAADMNAGLDLLQALDKEARSEGFQALIGPMDGDTWHRYRVVTCGDGSPPFLMEPTSGPHDLAVLNAAGYGPVAGYLSSLAPVAAPGSEPFALDGVEVTAWDGAGAERLVGHVYEASLASFAKAAFFKPISREDFLALYAPYVKMIDPRLVLFARDGSGLPVGFLFGMPDHLAPEGQRRAVLKTYAGLRPGVGRALASRFHCIARDLGYTGVVHALMRDDNVSRGASVKFGGAVLRRYALMGKTL